MPWTKDDLARLVELEAHLQGVDPRLARAVAEQESRWDPTARSAKDAYGIMQLKAGTAKDLGVNREDPADNIRGGVMYLKQQLNAFGGDVPKTLAAYNAGPGAVQAHKGVPPYKETQGYVKSILSKLGPASAEAAGLSAAEQSRLQELEAHLARLEGKSVSPPQAPPPTTPQAPPEPQPDPSATPGMRFQGLPSITRMEPQERIQRTQEFEGLTPALQEEFLRSEGSMTPRGPTASSTQIEPVTEGGAQQLLADRRTGLSLKEHARVGAATGIDILGTTSGAAVGAMTSPVTGPFGPIVGGTIGGGLAQRANVALGLREQETPLVEGTYANLYPSDVIGGGLNVAFVGIPAAVRSALVRSQAGKAIVAADDATTTARAKWQADTQAAEEAAKTQQKDLYETAVIKAKASQRDYEMARRARDEKIATGKQEYDAAVRAQQAEDLTKEQGRQQTITQRQQDYSQAVAGQERAITQARATPGKYAPETPSWKLYEEFGDAAKDAVVDLTPAKAAIAELRASRGVLPDGSVRPFPQAVESIAANMEKATGETSFKTIREELRRLGPLTRHEDGNIRGPAKQLYGIYTDVLEASPVANDLLKSANATFRKEMAIQDVADWLKPGNRIVRIDNDGRETINVGALLTRLEKTVGEDSLFRGSFTPDELTALKADLYALKGTPAMPRQAPRQPAAVVSGKLPTPPAAPAPVALPADVRVSQTPMPAATPEPVPVTPREQLGPRPRILGPRAGEIGAILAVLQSFGVPTLPLAGAVAIRAGTQQARWLMAHGLLSDKGQRIIRAAMDGRGTLHPRVYGALRAVLTPEEKKAYERETRGQGSRE